jgi:hypothetical protein
MAIVADFAFTKPSVAQLDSWGVVAVGMYLSRDPSKNATPELVRQYASAGIKTFLFFEDAAGGAAKGYSQGKADAALAKEQAAALGKPPWAPVVASCDFDIPDYAPGSPDPAAKLGPVAEYFKAWDEELGEQETGGYGGYWAVSRLAAAKLISVGVQTVAWSGGLVDTHHIAALQNARTLDNGNVDVEVIESANLLNRLAWVPGEAEPGAVPVAPPHPSDANWLCKGMLPLTRLAGMLHASPAVVLETTLRHNGGHVPAGLAGYLNAGDLAAAYVPAGTVLWYPRP